MSQLEKRKRTLSAGIFSLFWGWLILVVSTNAVLSLGLFMSRRWVPLVVVGILFVVIILTKNHNRRGIPSYYRIPDMANFILFLTAVVMIIINLLNGAWEPRWVKPQVHNPALPYISSLVVYTIMFFASIFYIVLGRRAPAFRKSSSTSSGSASHGLLSRLFQQESSLQLRVMTAYSGLVFLIVWVYYFKAYININLNAPDIFFFDVVPWALGFLSIVYFYGRYFGMYRHYCANPAMEAIHGDSTALRFIVIVGDRLWLDVQDAPVIDTPVKCFVKFSEDVSLHTAETTFKDLTGLQPPRLDLAYESEEMATLANSFHYLCFFDSEEQLADARVSGELYSYERFVELLATGRIAVELKSELERIYTVAMAWKTYTPEGKRIYPVRNYRPSFRFKDIKDYDVDYNDRRWLKVTVFNEDHRFYRLRRFWHKHVNGS